ncbi:PI-PLC X domain-containing protein 1-like [Anopheles albimanus]|uniref:Phosphatidylinositol-specific phospholipase C X domain-containing protein n=1 Tax=Anopheles albimanus TaxID=7167 RepID=A0A182FHM3_ANOAL|nr:PI-PLC X domain-containing protein 1-like [Anopheles albimanus]
MSGQVRVNNNGEVSALLVLVLVVFLQTATVQCQRIGDRMYRPEMADLYITVNARARTLELAWRNFDDLSNYILLAEQYPVPAFQPRYYYYSRPPSSTIAASSATSPGPLDDFDAMSASSSSPSAAEVTDDGRSAASTENSSTTSMPTVTTTDGDAAYSSNMEMEIEWEYDFRDEHGVRKKEVLFSLQPVFENGWTKTDIKFNYDLMKDADTSTRCYGYYAYTVTPNGTVLDVHCMRLNPTWMNDLRSHLSAFRMRELFVPGTHDSASYKRDFDPQHQETIVTKYALTQDDDIRSQLLQGVRYIDLRVGYYKSKPEPFWSNHGISRMHPLIEDLEQIRKYAAETKEIIVVDVQEFPVGFGKGYDIHIKLIEYLQRELSDVMALPGAGGWSRRLGDIWSSGKTVVLAYDHEFATRAYPHLLWRSVQQRWGNVQKVGDLQNYLFKVHHPMGFREYSYRPVADMAELTPDPWGVITDRYGGLRKMADSVNRFVSKWYFEDLGPTANVVAVDFVRGTSIIDAAIYWNLKRVPSG